MLLEKKVDIRAFAERVERLCEFLLDQTDKDGSDDVVVIQKLQEDAADIQAENTEALSLSGLDNYMRNLTTPLKE
jgi:hypothetical protein